MRDYEIAGAYHEGGHVVGHQKHVADQAEAEARFDHLHDWVVFVAVLEVGIHDHQDHREGLQDLEGVDSKPLSDWLDDWEDDDCEVE